MLKDLNMETGATPVLRCRHQNSGCRSGEFFRAICFAICIFAAQSNRFSFRLMKKTIVLLSLGTAFALLASFPLAADDSSGVASGSLTLVTKNLAPGQANLTLDGFFVEIDKHRAAIPVRSTEVRGRVEEKFAAPD